MSLNGLYEYFKLLAVRVIHQCSINVYEQLDIPVLDGPITTAEITYALRKVSASTNSGGYDVSTAAFKALASNVMFLDALVCVLDDIFEIGTFPSEWLHGTLLPVPKKGKLYWAENYRGFVVEFCLREPSTVLFQLAELWANINADRADLHWQVYDWPSFYAEHRVREATCCW